MRKILRNAIRCKICGDVIESKSVHNFVQCSCGSCFVDGGHEYCRRGFKNKDDYEELAEWEDEEDEDYEELTELEDEEDEGYEALAEWEGSDDEGFQI